MEPHGERADFGLQGGRGKVKAMPPLNLFGTGRRNSCDPSGRGARTRSRHRYVGRATPRAFPRPQRIAYQAPPFKETGSFEAPQAWSVGIHVRKLLLAQGRYVGAGGMDFPDPAVCLTRHAVFVRGSRVGQHHHRAVVAIRQVALSESNEYIAARSGPRRPAQKSPANQSMDSNEDQT